LHAAEVIDQMAVLDSTLLDRITSDPRILGGKPIVRGTRVSVELVLDHLAHEMDFDTMHDIFPHLTQEDIRACLKYASEVLAGEAALPSRPALTHAAS
jgi:uncharacterized protein (DUF433 family)